MSQVRGLRLHIHPCKSQQLRDPVVGSDKHRFSAEVCLRGAVPERGPPPPPSPPFVIRVIPYASVKERGVFIGVEERRSPLINDYGTWTTSEIPSGQVMPGVRWQAW